MAGGSEHEEYEEREQLFAIQAVADAEFNEQEEEGQQVGGGGINGLDQLLHETPTRVHAEVSAREEAAADRVPVQVRAMLLLLLLLLLSLLLLLLLLRFLTLVLLQKRAEAGRLAVHKDPCCAFLK